MNANDWFSNRAGRTLPYSRRDQVGGVLGGPLIRNKTFFFAMYEYTEAKSPLTSTRTVPTLLQRQGDFSQTQERCRAGDDDLQPVRHLRQCAGQPGTPAVPGERHSVEHAGSDRAPGPGLLPAAEYPEHVDHRDQQLVRAGHLAERQPPDEPQDGPQLLGPEPPERPLQLWSRIRRRRPTFSATWPLRFRSTTARLPGACTRSSPSSPGSQSPTIALERALRLDLRALHAGSDGELRPHPARPPAVHERRRRPSPCSRGSRPTATARSARRDGSRWIARRASITFSGSYTSTIGGHNIKAGAETRWNFLDYAQPGYPSGQFTFGRGITCRDRFSCGGSEGNGLAAMLLGWPSGGDFHIDPKVFTRSAYWGFYVHDDWRVVPKLTLNLGLRYDFDVPRWETQDRQSYWDLEAQSPIQVAGYDTRGVIRFVDGDNRSPFDGDMNNVQPRLGFAYALNPQTSIRGGYGLFFTLSRATVFGHTGGGVQRQLHAHVHARLQRHALRDARRSVSERHAAAARPRAGRQHLHRPGRRHHPAQQQPQPRVPLLEHVRPARGRLELGPRGQLHGQPRHAPVPADHDPDAAGSRSTGRWGARH